MEMWPRRLRGYAAAERGDSHRCLNFCLSLYDEVPLEGSKVTASPSGLMTLGILPVRAVASAASPSLSPACG